MEITKKIPEKLNLVAISIISFLPLIFILGSGILNLFIIILDLIFIFEVVSKKKLKYFNNKFFYSLILFWLILLINLIFSISFVDSLPRSFGFVRFIFFALAINYYFNESSKYTNHIFAIWAIIFFIISFDLIFEYIFGFNTLGFKSYMPGRLSGFFNQELKIGHLYSAIILICLSFIHIFLSQQKNQNKFINYKIKNSIFYLLFILFLFISLVIGERSNFIKTLLMTIPFLFLFNKKDFGKKLMSILITIAILFTIMFKNEKFEDRFWKMFFKPLMNNPIELVSNSSYGSHYKVALEVFNNNMIVGVGLKNYRKEVVKDGYSSNASIHPHQIHFEILSETGLLGYFSFLIFFIFNITLAINYFIKEKNIFQLSGTLFVIVSLMPILPSGSFFTSFGAALFWLNFGLMLPKQR